MKKIIIAGCGAAGMCAAVTAARCGASVTVIEKNTEAGKKLSMTGNGRCNLSNIQMNTNYFSSESEDGFRLDRWLSRFGTADTITFFKSIGVLSMNEDGYIYPRSGQAQTVTYALVHEMERLGVRIIYGSQVKSIFFDEKKSCNIVKTADKQEYSCDSVIMTTGGLSGPSSTMSTGDGYYIAKRLGAKCTALYPALVCLKTDDSGCMENTGVRAEARITLVTTDGRIVADEFGELQLTKGVISGIPALQAGGKAAKELYQLNAQGEKGGQNITAHIDFFPEYSNEDFKKLIYDRMYMADGRSVRDFLTGMANEHISSMILSRMGIAQSTDAAMLAAKQDTGESILYRIMMMYRDFTLQITGTGDYRSSQCTYGGISIDSLSDELELVSAPGVYIAGELADIDGRCGGYNLQWAWTSGTISGCAAAGMPLS